MLAEAKKASLTLDHRYNGSGMMVELLLFSSQAASGSGAGGQGVGVQLLRSFAGTDHESVGGSEGRVAQGPLTGVPRLLPGPATS